MSWFRVWWRINVSSDLRLGDYLRATMQCECWICGKRECRQRRDAMCGKLLSGELID